jgi:hypothetical protein
VPRAHISKETGLGWPDPSAASEFTFTPKHGSWLNLVEGSFRRCLALRHIRVASKQELKDRIMAAMDESIATRSSTWSYRLIRLPDMI